MPGESALNRTARSLFAPLADDYERWAAILSFGQDPLWRSTLVDHLPVTAEARVLDVACGTGAITRSIVRRRGCRVLAVDQSPEMLDSARLRAEREGVDDRIEWRRSRAEELTDLAAASFDGLSFGYLLRYLEDPPATVASLMRLLRPGAPFALLDFGVPPNRVARAAWHAYTGVGLPLAGRLLSPGWSEVGRYLRPSILTFGERYPPIRLAALLVSAGAVGVNVRRMSLGGGLVAWGVRAVG